MKQALIVTIAAIVMSVGSMAQAAQVEEARINVDNQTIEIDVAYSGGCEQHDFEVKTRTCTRATPMTCVIEVVDHTGLDQCRQIVKQTIEVPAVDYIAKVGLSNVVVVGDEGEAVELPLR